jgi:hypothetical protein
VKVFSNRAGSAGKKLNQNTESWVKGKVSAGLQC